eukprot:TRINITY_DN4710_c0_g4_i1.p2 TRINITY_DN4710_c0_g4~~TRINITY_DN4710_c0_g4_i1.p2  ORF type:complete len:183 (+),score=79.50 TRINITY_DN4710_c0_g4_i1:74-622(+)
MLRKGLEKRMMTLKKEKEDKKSGGKTSADIRVVKDLGEVDLTGSSTTLEQPDREVMSELTLTLRPTEGFYEGGTFRFKVHIPHDYPHTPPKVTYDLERGDQHRIFHPNIDEDGRVCLNILRAEWRPVLTLKAVIFGMELLFAEPNPDDPLNKAAAQVLRRDRRTFAMIAREWMQGRYVRTGA